MGHGSVHLLKMIEFHSVEKHPFYYLKGVFYVPLIKFYNNE